MNRILLDPVEVGPGGRAALTGRRARHVLDVLQAREGETVRVGLVNGPRGVARVEAADGEAITLACEFEPAPPWPPAVDLLLALPRPKVMKRLWAPLASLGLGRIVITNAAKVERVYFDTHWLEEENYRPLLLEGLEQSGDTQLPLVSIERRLKPFLEDTLESLFPGSLRLVGDPGAAVPLRALQPEPAQRLLLAVGPEGGWTDFERELLKAAGFRSVSLGWRTLRSDTACIALVSAAHALLAV